MSPTVGGRAGLWGEGMNGGEPLFQSLLWAKLQAEIMMSGISVSLSLLSGGPKLTRILFHCCV